MDISPQYGFATPKVSKMVLLDRSGNKQLAASVDNKLPTNSSADSLRHPRNNLRAIGKIGGKFVDSLSREQMSYAMNDKKPMATCYGHDYTWNGSEKTLAKNIFMDTSGNLERTRQSPQPQQKALSGYLVPANLVTNLNMNHRKSSKNAIDKVKSPLKAAAATISSDRNPAEVPSPAVTVTAPVPTQVTQAMETTEKQSEPETRKSFDPATSTMHDIRSHRFGQTKLDELPPSEAHKVDKEICGLVEGICICGKCKWPYDLGPKKVYTEFKSIYNQDFDKKKRIDNTGKLTTDFYGSSLKASMGMELSSTMRTDYKPMPLIQTPSMKPYDGLGANIPLAAVSSYQASFINYGPNPVHNPKVSLGLTIIPELPFINKTTYRDNFTTKNQTAQRAKAPPSNPIASHLPLVGESLYTLAYKPYKIGAGDLYKARRDDPEITPSFDGQFTSENRKTLTVPERRICPARTVIQELAKASLKAKDVLSTLH